MLLFNPCATSNSEASTSEFLGNLGRHICFPSTDSNIQSHTGVLPVAKDLIVSIVCKNNMEFN